MRPPPAWTDPSTRRPDLLEPAVRAFRLACPRLNPLVESHGPTIPHRRRSQAVRQRSAKPLCASSNLAAASKIRSPHKFLNPPDGTGLSGFDPFRFCQTCCRSRRTPSRFLSPSLKKFLNAHDPPLFLLHPRLGRLPCSRGVSWGQSFSCLLWAPDESESLHQENRWNPLPHLLLDV